MFPNSLSLRGIVGIEYDPHYCQYGWTAVSVWLDLFSNRQFTLMWIQLETTYTKQSAPAAGIRDSHPDAVIGNALQYFSVRGLVL